MLEKAKVSCPNCGRELYLEQVSACAGCKPILLRKCRCGYSEPVVEEVKKPLKSKISLDELRELYLRRKSGV